MRTLRAVTKTKGPGVPLRDINKHLKGLSTSDLHAALIDLQTNDFGVLYDAGVNGNGTGILYFKPHPMTFNEKDKLFEKAVCPGKGISHKLYEINFRNTKKMNDRHIDLCRDFHPHAELMNDILSQLTDSDSDRTFNVIPGCLRKQYVQEQEYLTNSMKSNIIL